MFIDLSPFRHKNFRRLFFGQLISAFGTQMTAVVIPFQVYLISNSTFYTGLVSGVEFIFIFFSSLLGGVLADRFEKRKILIWAEIGLSIIPIGLALNSISNSPNLWAIFILAAAASFLGGIHRPALEALTPRLVSKDEIAKISVLAPMRHILTTILSPMIGGLAMVSIGAFYTYLFDAVSFFISLLFLLGVNYKKLVDNESKTPPKSITSEIIEGYKYIKSRKEIFGSYASDFIVMVLCNPVALYPALAAAFNQEQSVGLLYAFPSIGGFLMTLTSRWTLSCKRYGVFIILSAAFWSLSLAIVGTASSFHWILFGLFCAGFFDMISGVFRTSLWNETIPESIRGRIAGFEMLGYMSGPLLGNAILGFLADLWGIQSALFWGSLCSLSLLALFNFGVPALWHYKKEDKNESYQQSQLTVT
jgi:MFS family permease